MPTPIFGIRLPQADRATLKAMSKVYGSKNESEFAREVLTTMCSGDRDRIAGFVRRLVMAAGEQLTLQLIAPLGAPGEAKKPRLKGRKRKVKRGPTR